MMSLLFAQGLPDLGGDTPVIPGLRRPIKPRPVPAARPDDPAARPVDPAAPDSPADRYRASVRKLQRASEQFEFACHRYRATVLKLDVAQSVYFAEGSFQAILVDALEQRDAAEVALLDAVSAHRAAVDETLELTAPQFVAAARILAAPDAPPPNPAQPAPPEPDSLAAWLRASWPRWEAAWTALSRSGPSATIVHSTVQAQN